MSHFLDVWSGRYYLSRATFTQFCFLRRTPRFPTTDNRRLVNATEGGIIIYWPVSRMAKLTRKKERKKKGSDLEARGYKSPPNLRSTSIVNKVTEASYHHRMKFAKIVLDWRSRKDDPPWSL